MSGGNEYFRYILGGVTKLFVSWTLGQMIIFHIRLCGVRGGLGEGLKIVSCQPDILKDADIFSLHVLKSKVLTKIKEVCTK